MKRSVGGGHHLDYRYVESIIRSTDRRRGPGCKAWTLVHAKLEAEPIEDLRIDFEDGYGTRPDAAENAAVDEAVSALLAARREGAAPPFTGIRFKSFEAPTRRRGLDTLARFVGGLVDGGGLPEGFVVTLPKVTAVEQVAAMVVACEHLERETGLAPGGLHFEIQVETPQSILLADGTAAVARMISASGGRCTALHYGTYDYSASLAVAAEYQSMEHPAADHAKAVMQVAAAGTGVRLSDGSTNVLPVGTTQARYAAWRLHARLVRRSLERGYYQGWDLHPAQLPTRYAATFAFYRNGFPAAAARLRAYVTQEDSGFLDEARDRQGARLVPRSRTSVWRNPGGRDRRTGRRGPGGRRAARSSRPHGIGR